MEELGQGAPDTAVPPSGFLRSAVWWRLLGFSLGLGLLSAIGALIFVSFVGIGTDILWTEPRPRRNSSRGRP